MYIPLAVGLWGVHTVVNACHLASKSLSRLVISTRHIAGNEQLFILYGPDYWCQDRFPVHVLLAAVIGYSIDIDNSAEWRKLRAYKELRTAYHAYKTNCTSHTSSIPDSLHSKQSDSSTEQVRYPPISQYDGNNYNHIDIAQANKDPETSKKCNWQDSLDCEQY